MNDLVFEKKNEVFTNSLIIAEGTGNAHESVMKMVKRYSKEISTLGKLEFSDDFKSDKLNKKTKACLLNEPQATFLMTLLKNSKKVVKFKLNLTKEFYRMRKALLHRSSTEWLQTRTQGKLREEMKQMGWLNLNYMQRSKEMVNHMSTYILTIQN